MQSKPKSNSIVTTELRADGTLAIVVLKGGAGGENRTLVFDPTKSSAKCRVRAELHGWNARIVDAAAKSRDPKTGLPVPASEKAEAMARLIEHYESGTEEWGVARAAPVRGDGLDPIIIAAVVEGMNLPEEKVRARVKSGAEKRGMKPAAYLALLAGADSITPIVERLRAEAAQGAGLDANAELEELGEDEEGD